MKDARIADFFATACEPLTERRADLSRRLIESTNSLRAALRTAREQKRERDLLTAEDFNVFEFIRPDENRLSDILAWLLDPAGSHGQRSAFLRRLLQVCSLPLDLVGENVKVYREETTTYLSNPLRRLDLLIDGREAGIGIENKPWALEQPEQVSDYCLQLGRKYGDRWALLYLSGDGSLPRSLSMVPSEVERRSFRLVSYASGLYGWIADCREQCQAEKVRSFLGDFAMYVRRWFTRPASGQGVNDG